MGFLEKLLNAPGVGTPASTPANPEPYDDGPIIEALEEIGEDIGRRVKEELVKGWFSVIEPPEKPVRVRKEKVKKAPGRVGRLVGAIAGAGLAFGEQKIGELLSRNKRNNSTAIEPVDYVDAEFTRDFSEETGDE